MRPEQAALDRALARAGQDIVLRRISGEPPSTTNNDITVRAAVRGIGASRMGGIVQELVGGIAQAVLHVIMSPTEITDGNWPGDGSLPRRSDRAVIAGTVYSIESVDRIYIGSDLVRIEMTVSG